jgi:two-component system OmpR family sensor kinase
LSRIPIRLRITLAFALAMAFVIAGLGGFLYLRLRHSLEENLTQSLRARAETLAALVSGGGELGESQGAFEEDETFVQVLHEDGSVIGASPVVDERPLVSGELLDRAFEETFFVNVSALPELEDEPARLLVASVPSDEDDEDETVVIVVGATLESVDEALAGLLGQLLIVGPLALLLTSVLGYLLAASALRPVEAMRRRADEISSENPGRRLPLPRARDEIRRLGETVNSMLGRLEEGLERERRFVADASHELRTPLALLRTELELALRRRRTRGELEESVRSAADEVDRLGRLAEDLLVLARADERGLPLRRESIETAELLDDVARRFSPRADIAGRSVEVDAADGGTIVGDRLRLEQALGNLVDNALRHGGGTISLDAHRRDGRIEVVVSDEGGGFPTDFLPRAFDRFTRADSARGSGAAGLGLAIVDVIARAHGGSATAANRDGHGAQVLLVLPAD